MNKNPDLTKLLRDVAVKSGRVTALVSGVAGVGISAFVLMPPPNRLSVPSNLVSLESKAGQQLLVESRLKSDRAILSQQFQTQELRAYCGVASGVMVLTRSS